MTMSIERIRKKVERGILGMPKKRNVLFHFTPRQGEECLSDSDDSDYYPGRRSTDNEDEEDFNRKAKAKVKKSMRHSKSQPPVKRRRRERLSTDNAKDLSIANGSDVLQFFPEEILINIFKYGIRLESVITFIPRVSRVCRAWREAASDPLLWAEIDLRPAVLKLTQSSVEGLLEKDLSCCRSLNLSGQRVAEKNIETLLEAMPSLTSLDLSNCLGVSGKVLWKVSKQCRHLERFKLCFTAVANVTNNVPVAAIAAFLQFCGQTLLELRLVRICIEHNGGRQILAAIEKYCPNLKVLDLRTADTAVNRPDPGRKRCDVGSLFEKLSGLSELRLDGFNIVTKGSAAGGMNESQIHLKDLKIYTTGYHMHEKSDHPAFYRMFGSTSKLQHLDISCSNLLPRQIISALTDVEELLMNDMRWRDSDHSDLEACINAWKHSVKRLELSHNVLVDLSLDCALAHYAPTDEGYPLQFLDLKATNVSPLAVVSVLKNCKDLQKIDLTSCRGLPRGCKRDFAREEFPSLIKNLKSS